LGPSGGERAIFDHLKRTGTPFRLLSWERDPISFFASDSMDWDVPYNQYWMVRDVRSFEDFLQRLTASRRKEARYLLRRFEIETDDDGGRVLPETVRTLMDATAQSFIRRGRGCIYTDGHFRETAGLVLHSFRARKMLRAVHLRHEGALVGLGIFGEAPASRRAVYLFNLYADRPNDVSAAVLLAIVRYCADRGLVLDGMRGAFSLKNKYGFQPEPSYAVVNDGTWKRGLAGDLSPDEAEALYGRKFGVMVRG
jgi:hypothetical protein